ncbi:keratin, type II cytoskeletal 1-like [Arachis ipaensis]|uniref:keratin, type II cytoskeletal 1-like n=1 Tax=Arachis ipaensis TaxID=130454 RepID=UPI0007AF2021|nr:keratin, type II cytoskeletal 1-like [Arachis ipaensis]XP_025678246.1 keratin, type II cytoskeletal 1-like [Arachis hypogaea]
MEYAMGEKICDAPSSIINDTSMLSNANCAVLEQQSNLDGAASGGKTGDDGGGGGTPLLWEGGTSLTAKGDGAASRGGGGAEIWRQHTDSSRSGYISGSAMPGGSSGGSGKAGSNGSFGRGEEKSSAILEKAAVADLEKARQ